MYSDHALCLISSRFRDEKSTCLSALNRAIRMQAIRTDSSLSRHKIQRGEIIDTRLENGRTTSNALPALCLIPAKPGSRKRLAFLHLIEF